MKSKIFRVVLLIVVLFQSHGVYAKAKHPLDPLSRQEIKEALSILSQEGLVNDKSRYEQITLSPKNRNLDPASIGDLRDRMKPVVIDQPKGVNFTLDGNMVHWQNWSFHVRFDKRVGLIISDVKYKDKDEIRSVMYQSFISEIFVPYMDPTQEWFFKSLWISMAKKTASPKTT